MTNFSFLRILLFLVIFAFTGCMQQPQRLINTKQPQVELNKTDINVLQNKIVGSMVAKEFYIVSSSQYVLDFRKIFGYDEDTLSRALMMSLDNSNIDTKGVDFFIIPLNDKILIKARPYLYKTYPYGRKEPEKFDMSNNNNWFNSLQTILNDLKIEIEAK